MMATMQIVDAEAVTMDYAFMDMNWYLCCKYESPKYRNGNLIVLQCNKRKTFWLKNDQLRIQLELSLCHIDVYLTSRSTSEISTVKVPEHNGDGFARTKYFLYELSEHEVHCVKLF